MQFGLLPTDKQGFPRFMYHAIKSPVIVNNNDDVIKLGGSWSRTYIPQEFPKRLYNKEGQSTVVSNKTDQEKHFKQGYQETPFEGVKLVIEMSAADKDAELRKLREQVSVLEMTAQIQAAKNK